MEVSGIGGPMLGVVLVPGLLAAGVGSLVFIGMNAWTGFGTFTLAIPDIPSFATPDVAEILWAVGIGVAAALLGSGIRRLALLLQPIVEHRTVVLTPVAGVAVAGLAIVFAKGPYRNSSEVLFSGQDALPPLVRQADALDRGRAEHLAVVCKSLAYGASLSAFRGGPTFPGMFIGAVGGITLSHLPGLPHDSRRGRHGHRGDDRGHAGLSADVGPDRRRPPASRRGHLAAACDRRRRRLLRHVSTSRAVRGVSRARVELRSGRPRTARSNGRSTSPTAGDLTRHRSVKAPRGPVPDQLAKGAATSTRPRMSRAKAAVESPTRLADEDARQLASGAGARPRHVRRPASRTSDPRVAAYTGGTNDNFGTTDHRILAQGGCDVRRWIRMCRPMSSTTSGRSIDVRTTGRPGMPEAGTHQRELKNTGYEIFVGILSILSIFNLVLLYAIGRLCPRHDFSFHQRDPQRRLPRRLHLPAVRRRIDTPTYFFRMFGWGRPPRQPAVPTGQESAPSSRCSVSCASSASRKSAGSLLHDRLPEAHC